MLIYIYYLVTCTAKPKSVLPDAWCAANCDGGKNTACLPESGIGQQCTCTVKNEPVDPTHPVGPSGGLGEPSC